MRATAGAAPPPRTTHNRISWTDLESVKSPHSAKFKHQSSNTIMKVLLLSKWPLYQCLWVVLLLETSAASRFSFVRFLYRFPHFSTTLASSSPGKKACQNVRNSPQFQYFSRKSLDQIPATLVSSVQISYCWSYKREDTLSLDDLSCRDLYSNHFILNLWVWRLLDQAFEKRH